MLVYIITIGVVICFQALFLLGGNTDKIKKAYLGVTFSFFFMVMALRKYTVGIDTYSYYRYFLRWGEIGEKIGGASQPVYYFYNRLLYFFIENGQAIIILNSFLCLIGIAVFIYCFSDNVGLSTYLWISLYFFFESMNISRTFVAVSFILIAFSIKGKMKSRFCDIYVVLLAIAAVGIHNLAFLFIPMIIVCYIKMNEKS